MDDFFTARVAFYDAHMLEKVQGCRAGYETMAAQVPLGCRKLLDLGCGTGLELGPIFRRFPQLEVTGIDLTRAMLDALAQKYPGKALRLICGSYFDVPFEGGPYDCAVSFQTLHHFSHEAKRRLYEKIFQALAPGGCYLECDYMVENQAEEDFYYGENDRLRRELGIPPQAFYHFDTPCTVENQCRLLLAAGFKRVTHIFREGNTTLLKAAADA